MREFIHVRRCHCCGEVSEIKNQFVRRCDNCGKHLAPFFYFDETGMNGKGDLNERRHEMSYKPISANSNYQPIWGLTAVWDSG